MEEWSGPGGRTEFWSLSSLLTPMALPFPAAPLLNTPHSPCPAGLCLVLTAGEGLSPNCGMNNFSPGEVPSVPSPALLPAPRLGAAPELSVKCALLFVT